MSHNIKKSGNKYRSVIFRRFRRLPDGTLLDAYKYGYKAWPIQVK